MTTPNQPDYETENRFSYFGLLPVVLSIALVAVFRVLLPSTAVFEPHYLLAILNAVFLALMPFIVAYLAGRSYVTTGSLNILLIGCALLAFGAGNLVAGWVIEHPGPNSTVTIHNSASLVASIFYVMAAFVLAEGTTEGRAVRRMPKLLFSYFAILLFVAVLSVASILGLMPLFFAVGSGPTPLRELVLTVAVILHTLSAIFALRLYWKRRMPFLYWYGLALLLIATGLAAVLMQTAVGSPIGWVGRIAQYIGGIYLLAAVIVAVRQARMAGTSVDKALVSFFRESELHYRKLVETAQDAIVATDNPGQVLLWNPAAEKVFGFARREAVGSRLADLVGLNEPLMSWLDKAGPAESPAKTMEASLKRKDGSVLFAEVSAWVTEVDGRMVTFVIRDITDRKQAEEALRESEEHYRSLFDNMLNGFAHCKMLFDQGKPKDFIYLTVNSAFEVLTGLKNVTGKNVSEVIPGIRESDPELFDIYGRVALTGVPERFERYVKALGMWFSISVYSPRREHFVAVFDVITERKRAEEALQKAHDELEQRVRERTDELQRQAELMNLTHDAIIARDLNQRVLFWNRGAEERYGWSSDEVKGKVTDDLLETVFPQLRQKIEEKLLLHGRWEGEVIHTTRDGREITVASRRALRRDGDGKPIAILEINSDITEQKRIEEQLRQSQKMEAVGTLAGGIAHDFNNILAAIIGFAELATDEIPADSEAQRHLKKVLTAGLRGRDLVKQILAFSRKREGERKQISLTPLVHESYELLRASLPATVQMSLAITTTDDYVVADPTQLQQVLMNLATNAAYAMQEAGGQLTIGLSSITFPRGSLLPDPDMEPGAYVKLTVRDTGTGMTEEVRRRIFEPFFTTKETGKGTGMGLAVVYGIVKSHGGAVTAQSEAGQGSTFEVYLPPAQKPVVNKEAEMTSALPTGTERILFVDDEELLVDMARNILESLGYHVTVAKHPTDAWNLFLEDPSRFDLVITDQTMPDTTGITLAQKMLRVRKGMPIVLCTGYSEMVSADMAKEAGICEFIMKPVVRKELAGTIRKALDGRKE